MKKIIIGIIIAIVALSIGAGLYSWKTEKEKVNTKEVKKVQTTEEETPKKEEEEEVDFKKLAEEQMSAPKKGEVVAKMTVKGYGKIKFKFFKEHAPKAVENFVTHSKNGYYNGLTFHRVINEFMIQGGDPKGNGTGGESIWKEPFKKEVTTKLFPYRGSLCMASSPASEKSLGSQFFITQAKANDRIAELMKVEMGEPESLINAYKENGGYPSLFMGYTVFGQVVEGMEVVDKIAKVETNQNDKPLSDVIIEKIEVEEEK